MTVSLNLIMRQNVGNMVCKINMHLSITDTKYCFVANWKFSLRHVATVKVNMVIVV